MQTTATAKENEARNRSTRVISNKSLVPETKDIKISRENNLQLKLITIIFI